MTPRVVVTGAGVISAIGAESASFERALYAGDTAVGPSAMFPGFTTAEIVDFAPQRWLGDKGMRVLDRAARLVCVATRMALLDSALAGATPSESDADIGMACGTMFGALHSIVGFDWSGLIDGPAYVNPMEFPNTVINSPAGQAAIKFRLRGMNSTVSAGVASGLYAIHYGAEAVRFGRVRMVLAGGVEELCDESVLGFQKAGVSDASGGLHPFQRGDGTVLGEGAALLVLESAESAAARDASAWAEVAGFGCAHDATSINAYASHGEGAAWAIEQALENAGVGADRIGCIIASANGSRAGDTMERRALASVFGTRLRQIPVAAPKAAFGEAMGASGALCALAGAIAACRGVAPPTPGWSGPSDDLLLSANAQPFDGDCVLVNALSCDGNNAALVLKRWTA